MQKWTVRQDGQTWLVLHNEKAVTRRNSEDGAWSNAWRRANQSAQRRGVKAALINDEIVVAGGDVMTSAEKQAARRQRHQEAAAAAGFDNIDSLVKAINEKQVEIVNATPAG